MSLSIIVAASKNGVIGMDGDMPWGKKPMDGKYFARMTKGYTLIMGRKTFESLPIDKIVDRNIVVVSKSLTKGVGNRKLLINLKRRLEIHAASNLDEAVRLAKELSSQSGRHNIMVVGGGSIYNEMLKRGDVDYIYLTEIDKIHLGDTMFYMPDDGFDLLQEKKDGELTYKVYRRKDLVHSKVLDLETSHLLRNSYMQSSRNTSFSRADFIEALFQEPTTVAIDDTYYYADNPIVELPNGRFVPLSIPHHHPLATLCHGGKKEVFSSAIDKESVLKTRGMIVHVPLPGANGIPLVRFKYDRATGEVKYAGRRPFNTTEWFTAIIRVVDVTF